MSLIRTRPTQKPINAPTQTPIGPVTKTPSNGPWLEWGAKMIGPTKPMIKPKPPTATHPTSVDNIKFRLLAMCPRITNHQHNAAGIMRHNTIPLAMRLNLEVATCVRNTRKANTLRGNPKSEAIILKTKTCPLDGSALIESIPHSIQQKYWNFSQGFEYAHGHPVGC
jgi:hypothetical protein